MKSKDIHYSKEWKVLQDLAKGNGLNDLGEAQLEATLNRKINWFLLNGATSVIVMILDIYGPEALNDFYSFLDYYMSIPDTSGHYHYSYKIKKDIEHIESTTRGLDFHLYLEKLKAELIKMDEQKGK